MYLKYYNKLKTLKGNEKMKQKPNMVSTFKIRLLKKTKDIKRTRKILKMISRIFEEVKMKIYLEDETNGYIDIAYKGKDTSLEDNAKDIMILLERFLIRDINVLLLNQKEPIIEDDVVHIKTEYI